MKSAFKVLWSKKGNMVREILCRDCRPTLVQKLGRDDIIQGWQERALFIALSVSAVCDHCAKNLQGQIGVAVTRWQGKGHVPPHNWEDAYGTVIPSEAVRTADRLSESTNQ